MKTITRKTNLSLSAVEIAETARLAAKTDVGKKSELGQFLTPMPVATMMASMVEAAGETVSILDAGAGAGCLFAAVVQYLCERRFLPKEIRVTAYELDTSLKAPLDETSRMCAAICRRVGIRFSADVIMADFLDAAADKLRPTLFPFAEPEWFDIAILNPPYYKIHSRSKTRHTLRRIGVETSNIYTGFLAAATKLLGPGGELIAITPRSFCNGTYFKAFRKWLLHEVSLHRIHSFQSRQEAFRDDDVLQETVIFHAIKDVLPTRVVVSSSTGPSDPNIITRIVDYARVVRPDDAQHFIRIPTDDLADEIAERMSVCQATLADLGLTVSTGRVVDFRARKYLREKPDSGTAPLVWPTHFESGYIAWPKNGSCRKPEAIMADTAIADQLIPNEPYVLVRRFSAKEERRRVVAAVYDPKRLPCERVGFENHLNYFHRKGRGISMRLSRGLAAFLNSTIVDQYFRQFSGHTQVNATDLRNMRYPSAEELERIGKSIGADFPDQAALDALVAAELFQADPIVTTLYQRVIQYGTSAQSRPA